VADNVIRIGVLTPHAARGPDVEFPAMAPGLIETGVARIMSVEEAGVEANQSAAMRTVADPRLDEAAEAFASGGFDAIGYASTSYAYGAGFAAEMAMVSRLARRVAVPVAATCASCVPALRALDVARVALVHPPWFGNELNELGAAYFQSQGMHVVSSRSARLTNDPRRIEAGAVCEWTSRHVSEDAEAVFIGGNGFRAAGAIACLETALGRPVITSNQVLLWNLLAQLGSGLRITGYGQLFAHLPWRGARPGRW
jgi:maleate isomerase